MTMRIAHGGAWLTSNKRVKERKRADPDEKLLEHRGVTVSELATELNGRRAWGREYGNTKGNLTFFLYGGFCEGRGGSGVFRFREWSL
jgi:hypothetical protein